MQLILSWLRCQIPSHTYTHTYPCTHVQSWHVILYQQTAHHENTEYHARHSPRHSRNTPTRTHTHMHNTWHSHKYIQVLYIHSHPHGLLCMSHHTVCDAHRSVSVWWIIAVENRYKSFFKWLFFIEVAAEVCKLTSNNARKAEIFVQNIWHGGHH